MFLPTVGILFTPARYGALAAAAPDAESAARRALADQTARAAAAMARKDLPGFLAFFAPGATVQDADGTLRTAHQFAADLARDPFVSNMRSIPACTYDVTDLHICGDQVVTSATWGLDAEVTDVAGFLGPAGAAHTLRHRERVRDTHVRMGENWLLIHREVQAPPDVYLDGRWVPLAPPSIVAEAPDAPRRELEAAIERFLAAVGVGDLGAFLSFVAPEITAHGPDGVIARREELATAWEREFATVKALHAVGYEIDDLRARGSQAVVHTTKKVRAEVVDLQGVFGPVGEAHLAVMEQQERDTFSREGADWRVLHAETIGPPRLMLDGESISL